jgi:hypothetical protein
MIHRSNQSGRLAAGLAAAAALLANAAPAWSQPDPDVCTIDRSAWQVCLGAGGVTEPLPPRSPGRTNPTLLATYPAFDTWSLDTSAVRDTAGLMHFAVRLWQYNQQTPNYDRYAVDPDSNVVGTWLDWLGVGGMPAFTDGNGHNRFVRAVATTQHFGVVDSADHVHAFYTVLADTGWEVAYAQFDEYGNTVIDWTQITTAADPWNWYLQPVVTGTDALLVTWIRDTDDLCAVRSDDGGATWSDITVLFDCDPAIQHSMLKTVVGTDDSLHLVWRTLDWSSYQETLRYVKLRPDGSIAVGETVFHTGPGWYPFVSLDDWGDLHVTFGTTYDTATSLYYTRLRGDLDLNGAPASDALLTSIPEMTFVTDADTVRYPVNLPDANRRVHVIYEEGAYGRGTDKDLYYIALCALVGDLDCNDLVNLSDLAALLGAYGACAGDPGYQSVADLDGNGCVDLSDLAALLGNYGAEAEGP